MAAFAIRVLVGTSSLGSRLDLIGHAMDVLLFGSHRFLGTASPPPMWTNVEMLLGAGRATSLCWARQFSVSRHDVVDAGVRRTPCASETDVARRVLSLAFLR